MVARWLIKKTTNERFKELSYLDDVVINRGGTIILTGIVDDRFTNMRSSI